MRVQVSRVDLDGRRIDFRLVREGEELLKGALKDKGLARDLTGRDKAGRDGGARDSAGRNANDSASFDGPAFKASNKRAPRKISEPLARAPRVPGLPLKAPAKGKNKDKERGGKSRRRS